MSFFQEACGVSIGQGTFNAVTGNQTNNTYNHCIFEQRKKKRTIYDEFLDIQRGLVRRIKDLDHIESLNFWNSRLQEYEVFRVERTISTAKIHGDSSSSSFTVVSYKGQDAQKAWKTEFRQFSETTNTTEMQLYGINRSSVPLLIFHGELLPVAHFWDRLGVFGQGYASTMAWNVLECEESEVWINPEQGTLIHGLEGPDYLADHMEFSTVETLPSSIELLLDEDVSVRYFSRLPLVKEFDREVINMLDHGSEIGKETSPISNQPRVFSTKTNSIIAVRSGSYWNRFGCLDDQVIMPDGRTRFTLTDEGSELRLYSDHYDDQNAWLLQASSVFHRLGISLDDDLSSYKLVSPSIYFRGSIEGSQRPLEDPPIYIFLHPFPPFKLLETESVLSTHTWSYDENGEIPIPRHQCEDLGLPTELSMNSIESVAYRWPSETYKPIHKWQIARGFDPTTTDFARYLEYPIYEVMPSEAGRFEKLCAAGPSEAPDFTESPCKDDQGQSVIGSIWSAITAPLTYAADEDSEISAALM
ncbi:hypothetical protein E1B28_005202 [Marasmius oreades]|uniref:Uncharacterized protein n=1 Tax=Marasmius oreades TaxID=181124 RepID=A0A9P8ADR8_9AGAR|nr:uncharacterized protein E1B28_005202 [Marasmius oreades]KAG7097889.1 hypothetical protein E1B28_005202 [Marasmius oreades]